MLTNAQRNRLEGFVIAKFLEIHKRSTQFRDTLEVAATDDESRAMLARSNPEFAKSVEGMTGEELQEQLKLWPIASAAVAAAVYAFELMLPLADRLRTRPEGDEGSESPRSSDDARMGSN